MVSKKLNDNLGHEAGDILLKDVSERLSEVTPAGGMVARMGGDEFVMVLPVAAHPEKERIESGGKASSPPSTSHSK
ncbi:diguanylate cyclase domain-containing protein [Bacillus sp. m3-13]|uniref:diguanylate cyclase domain-containing protein n=1 Tax=Bacillus sp. m3-13 TaxID=406124 RepID=UPI0001E89DDA|nr:diguanylate cyclase [Bacillus sp. m3-13]